MARVWLALTDEAAKQKWFGGTPGRWQLLERHMDVRVGGSRLVGMEMNTPGGLRRMWFTGEYREVVENQRLVYTESMSDESGNVLSPSDLGMPPGHPATTEVTVELQDLGGRTNMVLTHTGISSDSPGAAGWAMAFSKLAAHVQAQDAR